MLLSGCSQGGPPGRIAFPLTRSSVGLSAIRTSTAPRSIPPKAAGEAFEHRSAVRPHLNEPELAETAQIIADGRGRDAELASKVAALIRWARLQVAVENPLHEALLDNLANRPRLAVRLAIRRLRPPDQSLTPAAIGPAVASARKTARTVVRLTPRASAQAGSEPISAPHAPRAVRATGHKPA